jgi:hypothetical protein
MKTLALILIIFYKRILTPYLKFFVLGGDCRFTPTCSDYAYKSIEKHGFSKGLSLSFKRVLRCSPWIRPGFDPVRLK